MTVPDRASILPPTSRAWARSRQRLRRADCAFDVMQPLLHLTIGPMVFYRCAARRHGTHRVHLIGTSGPDHPDFANAGSTYIIFPGFPRCCRSLS